jgi:hypothetical protein
VKNQRKIPERLSEDTLARRARAAHVRQSEFLRGPVPMWWLSRAAALPGKALAVGIALWFKGGMSDNNEVKLSGPLLKTMGVGRKACYRALAALAASGLVTVRGGVGRRPTVTVVTVTPKHVDLAAVPIAGGRSGST